MVFSLQKRIDWFFGEQKENGGRKAKVGLAVNNFQVSKWEWDKNHANPFILVWQTDITRKPSPTFSVNISIQPEVISRKWKT